MGARESRQFFVSPILLSATTLLEACEAPAGVAGDPSARKGMFSMDDLMKSIRRFLVAVFGDAVGTLDPDGGG